VEEIMPYGNYKEKKMDMGYKNSSKETKNTKEDKVAKYSKYLSKNKTRY
jgi:hypothetical protein